MATALPTNGHYEDDRDEAAAMQMGAGSPEPPDSTPLLTELAPGDFPGYFAERDGRLYHAHHDSPYPLPVDGREQQRLNVQHHVLRCILGENYLGPVAEVLASSGSQKLALDFCSGTGEWVLGMAREFPHVHFRGFDIVPIATRYPPTNVQFEIHNVNESCRWRDHSVDLVHARGISMAVHDYGSVLGEVARVLRPRGLFISGEWDGYVTVDQRYAPDLLHYAPSVHRFFEILNHALIHRGIPNQARLVPELLQASSSFSEISSAAIAVPIGPWYGNADMQKWGRAFRAAHRRYAEAVKPLLVEDGLPPQDVADLVDAYMYELRRLPGLVSVYHTVHARRV